ncbi:acyltransferase [Carboxylicivirga sp. RSCT41]|uniref:acyltransferase n=1 Tax=Carboxylicivirga agarovorans TaxID=3417570 RepID=UPI003D34A265
MAFLSERELKNLGLKSYGNNVLISDKASIYSPELISIGSNVRIDDFCILSGNIHLGNYIHIAAYSAMYGKFGIVMEDYTGLSPRCTVFSATDDFSGDYLISPMVPDEFTNVHGGLVTIRQFSQIGANSVILPDLTINEGVAVGAMSLVKKNLEEWGIYAGCPVKKICSRSKKVLGLFKKIKN